jgi:hypothetical protein
MNEIILEVIEREGQKLFYCESEDFATDRLDAQMVFFSRYYDFVVDVSFEEAHIVRYDRCVDKYDELCWFVDKNNVDKDDLPFLWADMFAVGDVLTIYAIDENVAKNLFEVAVKYCYLRTNVDTKQLPRSDVNLHYVLGQRIENESFLIMVNNIQQYGKTKYDFFDSAREIIFQEEWL